MFSTEVKSGDVRSDIYFLGCVFYEMLTGRSPLSMTKDRYQRMARRRFEEVQPLKASDVVAPPSVFVLCETMMSLNPQRRYQTPLQLLDAVKAVRREVEAEGGKSARKDSRPSIRSLFVVESDERLQNALREKFRELGFRVFLASDPMRALDRFHQQPYDALIVDIGTTGDDGRLVYERIIQEAANKRIPCVAVAILAEEQTLLANKLPKGPRATTLVRPVKLKQLHRALTEMLEKLE